MGNRRSWGGAGLILGLLVTWHGPAHGAIHAGFPAEWRFFSTRSVLRDSASVARRALVRLWAGEGSLSRLSEGRAPGRGSPDLRFGAGGSRLSAEFNHGLWHAGVEGIGVTPRIMREDAFPGTVSVDRSFPRLRTTLRGALGYSTGGAEGGEGTLELDGPSLDLGLPSADLRPSLIGWVRVRALRGQDHASVTPALSVALSHLPIVASALPLAITAASELTPGALPHSRLITQLGWQGEPHGFRSPEVDEAPGATWAPWVAIGYGAPLDRRTTARLALTVAITLALLGD